MRIIASIALLAIPWTMALAQSGESPEAAQPSLADVELGSRDELVAIVEVSSGQEVWGEIHVRLNHKYAPRHVKNFVRLAEQEFYDGTLFHRVKKESFIQGGSPTSRDDDPKNDGIGGPGYTLPPEPNDKKHVRGAVAMASVGDKNSGSQFFIDLKDHPSWDGQYTVFGNVIEGIEVADRIGSVRTSAERPVEPIAMKVRVIKRRRPLKL
ncbi:MAG: peptidylprolyl isomerase [Candidatus Latescibacterota bacterium]|nr:MAG: peptidylprolyl isomerase [Candidatus Latescibacterota bacterium]